MRFVAMLLLCLTGGIAAASAQAVSHEQAVTPSTDLKAPAGVEQAVKPAEQGAVDQAERQATTPTEQPNAQTIIEQAAKATPAEPSNVITSIPVQPAAAQPVEQAATPAEKSSEPSAETPAEQPVKHAALHAVDEPTYYPVEDPPAQPIEQAAEACPGHPDALGTSRVITISPREYSLLGTIQYRQTLPLKDHEVVLTFDDGPIPPYTNSILDTLAANCVKATYFLVGEMARLRPYLVRRIYNEGHTIGTHTQHHPSAFQRLSLARVEREVDGGIASVDGALGNPTAVSPFFRIPGLGRTKTIEHFLEKKGLVTWSADVDTNDWWRGTTPGQLVKRTMSRLNAKGRGIILMHDIHADTALALPRLLKELKAGGYRVVQVVAAGERPKSLPQVAATAAEKEVWPRTVHNKTETVDAGKPALRHRGKTTAARRHNRHRYGRTARRGKAAAGVNYVSAVPREMTKAASY